MGNMKDGLRKARDKARSKREQTTQAFRDEMHEKIPKEELMELMEDVEWVFDDKERGGLLESMSQGYYGRCSLAGLTDYTDHRDDSMEEMKELVMEQLEDRQLQKGNYYDKEGNAFDTVVVKPGAGGWSAYCGFESGKSFFEWMRS